MKTSKPACAACGHVHVSTDAIAVGRLNASGVLGYRSSIDVDAPLRGMRAEAEADGCVWRVKNAGGTPC